MSIWQYVAENEGGVEIESWNSLQCGWKIR